MTEVSEKSCAPVTSRRSQCPALEKCVDYQLGHAECHWNQQGSAWGFLFSSFLQPLSFYVPLDFDMTYTEDLSGNLTLQSLEATRDNELETRLGQMQSEWLRKSKQMNLQNYFSSGIPDVTASRLSLKIPRQNS